MPNIVYVLTNPAMPGIVKISMTERDDVQRRMTELYTTGVPLPFECVIARQLEGVDAARLEDALHAAFNPNRINQSREFFQIEPEQVEALLQVMPGRDVTPGVSQQIAELEPEDVAAASAYKRRQARTNEDEFMESLGENGRITFERVLDLGKQHGMYIKWTKSGFSLYVVLSNKNVMVCFGYPYSSTKYNQSLYTAFDSISSGAGVPPEAIERHKRDALAIGPFEPAGRGNDIAYRTDLIRDESQVAALIAWLELVVRTIREQEGAEPGTGVA